MRIAWLVLVSALLVNVAFAQELKIGSGAQSLRLRIDVALGEQSLDERWERCFASLATYYDRNGDGRLSESEAARLPSAYALREVLSCGFTPQLGSSPSWAALDKRARGYLDAADIAAWYRSQGIGAPLVGASRLPHTAALNDAVVKLLDSDDDGHVTLAELSNASDAVARFDRNDDELIGAGELMTGALYPGAAAHHWLTATRSASDLPIQVIATRADAKSDVVAKLHWSKPLESGPQVSFDGQRAHAGLRISVRGDAGKLAETVADVRNRLEARFVEDDVDRDGALNESERERDKVNPWRALLRVADRDDNGQLSHGELTDWLALQKELAGAQVMLTVLYAEQGLLELLDADRDGALSRGELGAAVDLLTRSHAIVDGELDRAKLPNTLMITASQGYPRSPLGQAEHVGPAWFLAMDRNADGAVSQREFTGPPDAFRRLDSDGDHMLSVAEATAK
jgi:hypothetical protein